MSTSRIVPFKSVGDLPFAFVQRLREYAKKYGIEHVHPFPVADIVVAEWVRLKCLYGCSRYNRSWCCPPATPEPAQVRQILSEYSQALLLRGTHQLPHFYRDDHRKRSALVHCWKGTVSLERLLFLEGYHKAFSLVGESCALCKRCTYPNNCRFPQEKRPSIESFSIDVVGTLHRLGLQPNVAREISEPFTYYAIILVY